MSRWLLSGVRCLGDKCRTFWPALYRRLNAAASKYGGLGVVVAEFLITAKLSLVFAMVALHCGSLFYWAVGCSMLVSRQLRQLYSNVNCSRFAMHVHVGLLDCRLPCSSWPVLGTLKCIDIVQGKVYLFYGCCACTSCELTRQQFLHHQHQSLPLPIHPNMLFCCHCSSVLCAHQLARCR